MNSIILQLLLLIAGCNFTKANSNVTYTKTDSVKVVNLLTQGSKEKPANLMLYYGRKLEGVPYVAHTLEVNKKEQLIVNLRQLDCTTFVETVLALAMTTEQGSTRFSDYCNNLQRIRYRDGRPDGYTSRNHYFLWWMEENERKGIVSEVLSRVTPEQKNKYLQRQVININYMSTHSAAYAMLKGNSADIATIAKAEKASQGKTVMYIPPTNIGLTKKELSFVNDGDILAIATKKEGLDTSHIGIAVWGKDGRLHLLNASQLHKKVILEPMTLKQYMAKHPSNLGIWVLRPQVGK